MGGAPHPIKRCGDFQDWKPEVAEAVGLAPALAREEPQRRFLPRNEVVASAGRVRLEAAHAWVAIEVGHMVLKALLCSTDAPRLPQAQRCTALSLSIRLQLLSGKYARIAGV